MGQLSVILPDDLEERMRHNLPMKRGLISDLFTDLLRDFLDDPGRLAKWLDARGEKE